MLGDVVTADVRENLEARPCILLPTEKCDRVEVGELPEEEDREEDYPACYPMKLLEVVEPKVPEDAYDKVRRRFRLLYSSLTMQPTTRKKRSVACSTST